MEEVHKVCYITLFICRYERNLILAICNQSSDNNITISSIGGTTSNAGGVGQNAISYVQNLLDLKDRYDDFLAKSFNNDKYFKQVMKIQL